MTTYQVYGSKTLPVSTLERLVGDALGVSFSGHDSFYRGAYQLASGQGTERIEIQPNVIPGDDDEAELYDTGYPDHLVLVLVNRTSRGDEIRQRLTAVEGLEYLTGQPADGGPGGTGGGSDGGGSDGAGSNSGSSDSGSSDSGGWR